MHRAFPHLVSGHGHGNLFGKVPSFEIQDTFRVFAFDPWHEVVQGGDSAGNDVIESAVQGFCPGIDRTDIGQAEAPAHLGSLTPFSKTKQFYLLIDFLLKVFFLSNLIRIFVALYGTIVL